MKRERHRHPFSSLLLIAALFGLFLFAYFFPSLRSVNRIRRETRDRKVAIERFLQAGGESMPQVKTDIPAVEAIARQVRESMILWSTDADGARLEDSLARFFQKGAAQSRIEDCRWEVSRDQRDPHTPFISGHIDFTATLSGSTDFCRYLLTYPYRLVISGVEVVPGADLDRYRVQLRVPGFSGDGKKQSFDFPGLDMNSPLLESPLPIAPYSPDLPIQTIIDCASSSGRVRFPGWRKGQERR